jgi:hypothetical protein
MTNEEFHELFEELTGKLDGESGLIVTHFSKSDDRIQVLGMGDVGKAEALGVLLALATRFDFSAREIMLALPKPFSKYVAENADLTCLRRFEVGSREVLHQVEALYLEADQRHREAEPETLEKADGRTQSEIFKLIRDLYVAPLLALEAERARLCTAAEGLEVCEIAQESQPQSG